MSDAANTVVDLIKNGQFQKLPPDTQKLLLGQLGIEAPRTLPEKAVDFVTGRREKELDAPDFDPGYLWPEYKGAMESIVPMKITDDRSAFYNAAVTDEARQEILAKYRPDLAKTLKKDRFGNPYVEIEGQPRYLNQPGASAQDARNLLNLGFAVRGPTKLLKKPLTSGSVAVRTGAAGLVGAGGSVAQDVLAGQGGATEGISGERAALNAGLSAATMFAWPIIKALGVKPFQAVFGKPSLIKGEFTTEAIEAFRKAGIDPKVFTQAEKEQIAKALRDATDPSALAAAEEALRLKYPVPLTKGQASGDRAQQALEYQMREGLLGKSAQEQMERFDTQARSSVAQNVQDMRSRIGGKGQLFSEHNLGVGQAQLELGQDRIAAKAKYKQLYDDIENFSDQQLSWVETPERFRQALMNLPEVKANLEFHPKLRAVIKDYEDNVMGLGTGPAGPGGTTGSKAPSVNELFDWRKRLNAVLNASTPDEQRALIPVKRQFDQFMKDTVADGLVRGDPALIDMWKKAIKSRADYGRLFEGDDIIDHITALTKDGLELAVDPHAAGNLIFGASDTGFVSKWNIAKNMKLLKSRLTPQSWDALRSDTMLRVLGLTRDELEAVAAGSAQLPSGAKFKTNLDAFRTRNKVLYDLMFTPDENSLITKVADVWKRVTVPKQGAANPSGSGLWTIQATQRSLSGPVGQMVRELLAFASPASRFVIKPIRGSLKAGEATGYGGGYVPPAKMLTPPPSMVSPMGGAEERLLDRYQKYVD